jgi:hypothetical protein
MGKVYDLLKEGKSNESIISYIEKEDLKNRLNDAQRSKTSKLIHFDLKQKEFLKITDDELEVKVKNDDILKVTDRYGYGEYYIIDFFEHVSPLMKEVVKLFNGDHLKFFAFVFAKIDDQKNEVVKQDNSYEIHIPMSVYNLISENKITIEEVTELLAKYDEEWNVIRLN